MKVGEFIEVLEDKWDTPILVTRKEDNREIYRYDLYNRDGDPDFVARFQVKQIQLDVLETVHYRKHGAVIVYV